MMRGISAPLAIAGSFLSRAKLLLDFAPALLQSHRLAHATTEKVEFRAADHAAANHFDLFNSRRVEGKFPLDPFVGYDATNRKHFTAARSAPPNHDAREDLDAFFVAFENLRVYVDRIADLEVGNFPPEHRLFNEFHDLLAHDDDPLLSLMFIAAMHPVIRRIQKPYCRNERHLERACFSCLNIRSQIGVFFS